jgi:hypothetical protein
MNIIHTKAPIGIEDLKAYFQDKDTKYLIDYGTSDLKGDKLLTYLGNLDIPCDIIYDNDESLFDMVESYLKFTHIVNIESLEVRVIDLIFQRKNLKPLFTPSAVDRFAPILDQWIQKLESLVLFNAFCINDDSFKDYVRSHKEDDTDSIEGINFVSLLKHSNFYSFYENSDDSNLTYYSKYFNDHMFKGKNLYAYWANENNPMFLLTWGIAVSKFENKDYVEAKLKSIQEISNVSPIQ